jgi:hypothetical protein
MKNITASKLFVLKGKTKQEKIKTLRKNRIFRYVKTAKKTAKIDYASDYQ